MVENIIWEHIEKGLQNFHKFLPENKILKNTTHIPLLLAAVSILKHDFVLEFGSGMFSTPIFYNSYVKNFTTIEDDEQWIKYIKKEFPSKKGFTPCGPGFIFKRPNRSKELAFYELTIEQQEKLLKYYKNVHKGCDGIDLLFIDQMKYGRGIAIKSFYDKSDVVIFHDCQHIRRFGYEIVNEILKGKKHDLYMYKTVPAYTGVLVRKDVCFDYNSLAEKIKFYENKYFNIIRARNKEFSIDIDNSSFSFVKQKSLG